MTEIFNYIQDNSVFAAFLLFFLIVLGKPILFGREGADDQDWHDTLK